MTKAKARARAKARAAAKAANPGAKSDKPEAPERPGRANTRPEHVSSMAGNANIKSASAMRRGAARSR
ncbi:MAG: hypothetical protein GY948_01880 [Alphaproteobacteria bacterium]|nr:hypothetical protein [Alphaproteobacteria bacterium]